METNKKNLDDLIFENRNKAYGAYANRKNYSKYMVWALSWAIALFFTVISVPLIANYFNGSLIAVEDPYLVKEVLTKINNEKKDIDIPEAPATKKAEPVYSRFIATIDTFNLPEFVNPFENLENRPIVGPETVFIGDDPENKPEIIDIPKLETHTIVEEMPEFPGGDAGRLKYLSEHIKYPQAAREIGIAGTVYVQFVIDETGKVVELALLRGIGGGCDEEAMRVISEMPRWKPGRQTGRAVRVQFSLPITFTLR